MASSKAPFARAAFFARAPVVHGRCSGNHAQLLRRESR
jgi:hypothetical protein